MNIYKFFYGNGQLAVTKALALSHLNLYQRLVDWKRLPKGQFPEDYVAGTFYADTGEIQEVWRGGNTPSDDALRFLIRQEIEGYTPERYPYYGATVEDTEPEFNFSFLTPPHDKLYPCAWENDKMRPDAKRAIKSHALKAIEGEGQLAHADQWVYFTVYGSGASYNWDEEGDFDVQMWVDIQKYNEHHDVPMEAEELLKEIRMRVQPVNFPSFADLGLDTDDCEGKMLIQFYPKLGTGERDENLAQKPYACYDMETDEWIVQPKPITPEFYGQHFVMVIDKCQDVADQANALIDQFHRDVLTWQFFSRLYSDTKNKLFLNQAEQAQINATKEQQGIATLFEGVFGGRQKAYSPEGKGIEDEGDVTQKLLEVWGVFQQLKHWSRAPLPWDPQEMPNRPIDELSKEAVLDDKPASGTFGYVNGHLVLGIHHHKAILQEFLNNGWTWEQLFNIPQAWGWYTHYNNKVHVKFASDSGYQSDIEGATKALAETFNCPVEVSNYVKEVKNDNDYGTGLVGRKPKPGGEGTFGNLWGEVPSPDYEVPPEPQNPGWWGGAGFFPWKTAVEYDPNYYKAQGLPASACFGYIGNQLLIGQSHHAALMGSLINAGWTWEQMMESPQAWGWYMVETDYGHGEAKKIVSVNFVSDSGFQNPKTAQRALGAIAQLYHLPAYYDYSLENIQGVTEGGYGTGLSGEKPFEGYGEENLIGDVPPPPTTSKPVESSMQKEAVQWEKDYYQKQKLPSDGCFGFVNGHLILGKYHHQAIMMKLIDNGWTWEQLMNVPQAWGWYNVDYYGKNIDGEYWPRINISFSSDAGIIDEKEMKRAKGAFAQLYHMPVEGGGGSHAINPEKAEEQYGKGLHGKGFQKNYQEGGEYYHRLNDIGDVPEPPESIEQRELQQVEIPSSTTVEAPKPLSDKTKVFIHSTEGQEIHATPIDSDSHSVIWYHQNGELSNGLVNNGIMKDWIDQGFWIPKEEKSTPSDEWKVGDKFYFPTQPKEGPPHEVTGVTDTQVHFTGPNVSGSTGNWSYSKDALEDAIKVPAEQDLSQNPGGGTPPPKISSLQKFADWDAIMQKAQKIRQNGGVQITVNEPDHVVGTVQSGSDPQNQGPYTTEIWRDDPNSQAITMWDCDCPWSDYSWGRTRQWKKYEGRPCAHTLALFWEAQTKPPVSPQAPSQAPPTPTPGGGMVYNQGLIQPLGQPPAPTVPLIQEPGPSPVPVQIVGQPPAPAPTGGGGGGEAPSPQISRPSTAEEAAQKTIGFPGALSHWKEADVPATPPQPAIVEQYQQQAPAAPPGVTLPTMGGLDWTQTRGTPPGGARELAGTPTDHAYPQMIRASAATIQLNNATIADPRGFVCAWVGANDGLGEWIQGGVVSLGTGYGKPGFWVYLETMQGGRHNIQYIRQVQAGAPVNVAVSNRGNAWYLTIDGHTYGPVNFRPRGYITVTATAESAQPGGTPNNWHWHFSNARRVGSLKFGQDDGWDPSLSESSVGALKFMPHHHLFKWVSMSYPWIHTHGVKGDTARAIHKEWGRRLHHKKHHKGNVKEADGWQFWKEKVPEQYQTPEEHIPQKMLPYVNEYDPEVPMRWSYHPEHGGLWVWPEAAGYHIDWANERGIPGTVEGDRSYAGGIIAPHGTQIYEYHSADPALADEGVRAVQQFIGPQYQSEIKKFTKTAAFQNGDIVRTWDKVKGWAQPAYGQSGYEVLIGKNKSGEVLSSDDETTVVIFPLNTGPLQHHLVKVECPTSTLYLDNTNAQPFIKRQSSWDDYDEGHVSYEDEAKEPGYNEAFIYIGAPYHKLYVGGWEHSDLIQQFFEGEGKKLLEPPDEEDEYYDPYDDAMDKLPDIAAGHIGSIYDERNDQIQKVFGFYSDFFSGSKDFSALANEAAVALKKKFPGIRAATDAENAHRWAGPGEFASFEDKTAGLFGDVTEWKTKPELWEPKWEPKRIDPSYQFQMPVQVEKKFVQAMECPYCHHNLRHSDSGPYCEYCGWQPRPEATV